MAQTIIVQEQALNDAQARIDELESSGVCERRPSWRPRMRGPWDNRAGRMAGGGFLAGAAQTAMGVAGGVLSATCSRTG